MNWVRMQMRSLALHLSPKLLPTATRLRLTITVSAITNLQDIFTLRCQNVSRNLCNLVQAQLLWITFFSLSLFALLVSLSFCFFFHSLWILKEFGKDSIWNCKQRNVFCLNMLSLTPKRGQIKFYINQARMTTVYVSFILIHSRDIYQTTPYAIYHKHFLFVNDAGNAYALQTGYHVDEDEC